MCFNILQYVNGLGKVNEVDTLFNIKCDKL